MRVFISIFPIIALRLIDVVLICLLAYGVSKKSEPGDWKVWTIVVLWFVVTGMLEKFL